MLEQIRTITQALIYVLFLILGVFLGRLGQGKVNTAESPKEPLIKKLSPMEYYKQKEEKRLAEREQKIYQANLENINNYNGTSDHQKDIPKE
jgi:hypothetical protein